jgi:integrase
MNVIASLSKHETCKSWLEGLRSESTKRVYAVHLSVFCRFYHTNPDELIKKRPADLKDMITKYILELKRTCKKTAGKPKMGEMSVNSVKQYLVGVRSFLEEHEISLPWKKFSKYYPEEVTNDYRAYTRQEISKLLSVADLRDSCIILLMASSGIRVGAIPTLTIKSLKKLDEGLGLLTVYGDSKKSRYVTLVTPECLSTIEKYLEQRRKQGEKLTDRSPLIRDKYDIYSIRINTPRCPKETAINAKIRHLIRKAGLAFEELQPDHALRIFFNTMLANAEVRMLFKELMMGHSVKLDKAYYDENNEESHKKIVLEYMKAVDALTINDEYRLRKQIENYEDKLKGVPKLEQLQEQLANKIIEQDSLKITVEKLQSEKELQDNQMKAMRDMVDHTLEEMMTMVQKEMTTMVRRYPKLKRLKRDAFVSKKIGDKTFLLPRYSLLNERPVETKVQTERNENRASPNK